MVIAAALSLSGVHAAVNTVDENLPEYQWTSGVSGNIKSVGSDTMNNLMTLWTEGFRKMYPNVMVEVEGKGSSTAAPALIAGTSTFGPMSRAMKNSEQDDFEKSYGYKATYVRTSIDMLAVYVHKDNPIAKQGLTIDQLDGIFSKTRKSGSKNINTWGDLGLTGEWSNKPISIYGRNSASGTYGYYKKMALLGGDFKDTVKEQPGSSAVVQGVANDKYAIGYSGIGYRTADVSIVPLAPLGGGEYFMPTSDNSSTYPLARYLYLYLNYRPGSSLDPLRAEFLAYIFSTQGQNDVLKDGYMPVSATVAEEDLTRVGIEIELDADRLGAVGME